MADLSAIWSAEEGLIELLEAQEALEEVSVTRGKEPTQVEEYLWLWKAEAERDYENLGNVSLRETIKLYVEIRSYKTQPDEVNPSRERASELLNALETAVAGDRSLKDSVVFARVSVLSPAQVELDGGKQAYRIAVTIEARARI